METAVTLRWALFLAITSRWFRNTCIGTQIFCPEVLVTNRMFECLLSLDREDKKIQLRVYQNRKTIAWCAMNANSTRRRRLKVIFLVKNTGNVLFNVLSDGVKDMQLTKKASSQEGIGIIESRGSTNYEDEFTVDSQLGRPPNDDKVPVIWELYRYYPNPEEDTNCFFEHRLREINMAKFISHRTVAPVEFVPRGRILHLPSNSLPVGNVIISALLWKRNHFVDKAIGLNVLGTNHNPLLMEVTPFTGQITWSIVEDLVVNFNKTICPHFTPESGFYGDPSPFLTASIKCTNCPGRTFKTTKYGRSFLIRKEHMLRTNLSRLELTATLKVSYNALADRPQMLTSTYTWVVVLLNETWPHMELRCIRNCITSGWYSYDERLFRFFCPQCDDRGLKYHAYVSKPCAAPRQKLSCGRLKSYVIVKPGEKVYVQVANANTRGTHTFTLDNWEAQKYTFRMSDKGNVADLGFSDSVISISLHPDAVASHDHNQPVVYYFNCVWTINGVDVTLPWIVTTQKSVGYLAFNLYQQESKKSLLPMPKLFLLCYQGLKIVKALYMSYDHNVETLPTYEHSSELRKIYRNTYEGDHGFELPHYYGLRLIWLMVRVASSLGNGRYASVIKKKVYNRFIHELRLKTILYSEAPLVLDALLVSLRDETFRFENESATAIPKVLNSITNVFTSVIKDLPPVFPTLGCLLLEAYVAHKSVEKVFKELAMENNTDTIPDKLTRHHIASGRLYQFCQGERWFMLMDSEQVLTLDGYFNIQDHHKHIDVGIEFLFGRRALYSKLSHDEERVIADYHVFIVINHLDGPFYPKPWIKGHLLVMATTMVEQYRRYDQLKVERYRHDDSIRITHQLLARNTEERLKRLESEETEISLDYDFTVEDGEVQADCSWVMFSTDPTIEQLFAIKFNRNFGTKQTFLVGEGLINSSKDLLDFGELANYKNFSEGDAVYNIDPVSKPFKFQNPDSMHVFMIKLMDVESLSDGLYDSDIIVELSHVFCSYLAKDGDEWEMEVCVTENATADMVTCKCTRSAGIFALDIEDSRHTIHTESIRKKLELVIEINAIEDHYVVIFAIVTLWLMFIAFFRMFQTQDVVNKDMYRTHLAKFHFNPEDHYRYLLSVKTSAMPNSGMRSRVWVILVGNLRTSGEMLLDNGCNFKTNSEAWFLASCALNLGSIKAVIMKIDSGALHDTWRIKYVDIYDISYDIMVRAMTSSIFTRDKPCQICISQDTEVATSYKKRLFANTRQFLTDYHYISSAFFVVPGAHSMVRVIIRILFVILWCFVITIVFVIGVPAYRFPDEVVTFPTSNIFIYVPMLTLIDKLYLFVVNKIMPHDKHLLRVEGLQKPKPRLICPNTEYEGDLFTVKTRSDFPVRPGVKTFKKHKGTFKGIAKKMTGFFTRFRVALGGKNVTKYDAMLADTNNSTSSSGRIFLPRQGQFKSVVQYGQVFEVPVSEASRASNASTVIQSVIKFDTEQNEQTTIAVSRHRNDLKHVKQYEFIKIMKEMIREVLDQRFSFAQQIITSGIESRMDLVMAPIWHQFADIPTHYIIHQEVCQKDPIMNGKCQMGKGIYSMKTLNAKVSVLLADDHSTQYIEVSSANSGWNLQYEEKLRKNPERCFAVNIVLCIITLNIFLCTAYVVQTSLHQRQVENYNTVLYAFIMMIVDVFLLEPCVFTVLAAFESVRPHETSSMYWAKKRTREATTVLNRLYLYQEKNLINRFQYRGSHEYQEMGTTWFQRLVLILQHERKLAGKDSVVKMGRMRLVLLVMCAAVIVNIHGDVNASYILKKSIYNELRLTNDVEHAAVSVDHMWDFLDNNHLKFLEKQDGVLRIFSVIRQVRVQPVDRCDEKLFPELEFDKYHCHPALTPENIETGDYCDEWGDTTPDDNYTACNPLFQYTFPEHSYFEGWHEQFPLGGYQYIMLPDLQTNLEITETMQETNWVDENTRAILIESSILDRSTGIAVALTVAYRFQENGIRLTTHCKPFAFIFEDGEYAILYITLAMWTMLTITELSSQLSKMSTIGLGAYLTSANCVMQLFNLIFYIGLILGFALRAHLTTVKFDFFQHASYGTEGHVYFSLNDIAFIVMTLNSISGFLAFFTLLRVFENLEHIERFHILLQMIKHVFFMASAPIICILLCAFLLYVRFNAESFESSSVITTIYSVTQFILTQDVLDLGDESSSRAATLVLWFIFFIVITNGFLVALNEDYSVLKMESRTRIALEEEDNMEESSDEDGQGDEDEDQTDQALLNSLSTGV